MLKFKILLHEFTVGIFPENRAEFYEDQGERFHQYMKNEKKMESETMGYWYNGEQLLGVLLGHTRNKSTNHYLPDEVLKKKTERLQILKNFYVNNKICSVFCFIYVFFLNYIRKTFL